MDSTRKRITASITPSAIFQGRFKAILVEKDAHLLELCRYVVLNPVRAKLVPHARQWPWSSYRATAGEVRRPGFLTTDWVLAQFSTHRQPTHEQYRRFVADGRGQPGPWEGLTGQMYLGSEDFVARHQPNQVIAEIPRQHTAAAAGTGHPVPAGPASGSGHPESVSAVWLSIAGNRCPSRCALCHSQSPAPQRRAAAYMIYKT